MFDDVEKKIKGKNKILFNHESRCLKELIGLMGEQKHLTLVLWAFDCLKMPMAELMSGYPDETRFQSACDLCMAWAHGEVKMPVAKRAILDCHGAAGDLSDDCDIALCHAVGQGCSVVHVGTHAPGLAFYELTAIVVKCGYADYQQAISDKIGFYIERLQWWQKNMPLYKEKEEWAAFLLKDF